MKRWGVVLILVLAFCGVANATYLAQHQVNGTPLNCGITTLSGCNTVVASPYSLLLGIPVAEYGILFYGIIFVLAALELVIFDQLLRRCLMWISLIGAVVSLYLLLVQVFVIGALCIYCLASMLIEFCIFALATLIHVKHRSTPQKFAPPPAAPPKLSMPPVS